MINDSTSQPPEPKPVNFVLVKSPARTKIFISHTSADEPLAAALVNCLLSSMILDDGDIRCTSVPGHKLPVGSDFASTLRDDIGDSSVVIGLITKNALTSSWVLFELGATWGSEKNLKPLVASDVPLRSLPGPLSGRHAAQLSDRGDVTQFIDEVATLIGAQRRTPAKTGQAIETFLAEHKRYVSEQRPLPTRGKPQAKQDEPTFGEIPFSELVHILGNEKLTVPAKHMPGAKADFEQSLLDLFVANSQTLANGIRSDSDRDTGGGFLYHEVGLRLLRYGLTHFEKLPAAQAKWYKQIATSEEGHKFLRHIKRRPPSQK
jgi:hypothetical protein